VLLVSWNVAGRVRRVPDQAARIAALRPDAVCLQEVTARAAPLWEHAFRSIGLGCISRPPPPSAADTRKRTLSVLTATRERVEAGAIDGVPWPERALAVTFADGFELINVHSPISPTPGMVKVRTHEALHAYLCARPGGARALCGDLNTPRREHPDGRVWTFARDRYGRLRPERGERWDAAELALIKGLEPYGFRDAFRSMHGYGEREPTWEWPRWGGGWRLDHLIVSGDVTVRICRYEHDWRRAGLSDHSALVAELEPNAAGEGPGRPGPNRRLSRPRGGRAGPGAQSAGHRGSAAGP
jgi:exonuclease III